MGEEKVNIMYDENGSAIRVQMDFDLYQWLLDQVPQSEQALAMAS